jgi:hypothetical protein
MHVRKYFVGVAAFLMAATTIVIAGPAGAASSCTETMNPAANGNSSGLTVACEFSAAGTSAAITIDDYADAVWHYGAARKVAITIKVVGGSSANQTTIKTCPTNNAKTAKITGTCPTPGAPPGMLAITSADINHSIEFPTSNSDLTAKVIPAGAFIKSVSGTTVTLGVAPSTGNNKTLKGATCASGTSCAASKAQIVYVSNTTSRDVIDGKTGTAAGSTSHVTSASANFRSDDVGARISGGDLPDGATISAVNSTTDVTMTCAGCVGGFTGVSSASNQVISLSPANPPTSSRYVTDGTSSGKTLSSATAEFAKSDIGMEIIFNPVIGAVKGARIASVAADGSSATLTSPANIPGTPTPKKFTIGYATKTAPKTKDIAGTLSILLEVNPTVSPTSPPCAADKVSGFQIPLQWNNPGSYNTKVVPGSNQFSGTSIPGTSIAQLDFKTASTSFAGYVLQNYTTTAMVNGASTYQVKYTFLPVTIGICPGTGDASTWTFNGLGLNNAQAPSFTGGGGGGLRGIGPEPQGTSTLYTGATGARVSTGAGGANQPSNSNGCTVSSPSLLVVGC